MAWESRERGGLYYTRSLRDGGRVRRVYVGCGETAELIARCDANIRRERERTREAERVERAAVAKRGMEIDYLDTLVEGLARAALLSAGYRRHHRGEWRKRRDQEQGA